MHNIARHIIYINALQIVAQISAFGEFWLRLSHLSKFNACLWHSACTKFGGLDIFCVSFVARDITQEEAEQLEKFLR